MPENHVEAFSEGIFAVVITLHVLQPWPGETGLPAGEMIIQAILKILAFRVASSLLAPVGWSIIACCTMSIAWTEFSSGSTLHR